ncbi:MAG: phosphatase PAP2 family protein [Xanthomonadaceae bacterium]|nr:phosphatase PAP2 family protein [Xanthomonadaceae bacterium]
MKNIKFLVIGIALAAFSLGMDWHKGDDYSKPVILKDSDFDLKKAIPPPPAKGSAQEKKDFKVIHDWQKKRTKEQCDNGKHVVDISIQAFYGKPYGPLSDAEVKALDPFLDQIRWDAGHFAGILKAHYNRPRPYITDSTLEPCARREVNAAYPSGHTTMMYAIGAVLSKWDPKRKSVFMKRAEEVSQGRIQVGVHHPSDIDGGKKLAQYLVAKYWKDAEFMKAFKALPAPGSIH